MVAKRSGQPKNMPQGTSPLVGLLIAAIGAGFAFVVGGVVLYFVFKDSPEPPPAPPVVVAPKPQPPQPPPPVRNEPWWESLPDSTLTGTAVFLKEELPQEKALFDNLGSKVDATRLAAYPKLLAKLPELNRNAKSRILLERFVVDCYAYEPADKNTVPLRDWFSSQIPKTNTEHPTVYTSEEFDHSSWVLKIGIEALTHQKMPAARVASLAKALTVAIGADLDPITTPRAELQIKAEKLLALRCYRNLAPTSVKSIQHALTIREMLLKKAGDILSPASRLKVDVEIVFNGLPGAATAWPAYSALLRDCLQAQDMHIDLAIVAMYAKADADLADKLEPVLAERWSDVIKDGKLNQVAKVAAIRRVLGVPEPINRQTQLDKLVKETLANSVSPAAKTHAVLQETVRLAHASTLACALLKREAGHGRFDELVSLIPEIEPDAPPTPAVKDDKTKKDNGDPKPPVAGKAGPVTFSGVLRQGTSSNSHPIALKRGKTYFIHMDSKAFDSYLRLLNSRGVQLAQDDDSGGGLNALITFTCPADDKYTVVATSFRGRAIGPYTVSVEEAAGPAGPPGGFLPPGFAGFPPFPLPRKLGRFPPRMFPGPPLMIPGQPPVVIPGQLKDSDKDAPATVENPTQVEEADLKNLGTNVAKTRVAAFLAITSKLKGSLADKDLTPTQATRIAKYLVSIQDSAEVDDVAAKMMSYIKSRNLMLALADAVDLDSAKKETTETVVGALFEQPLLFSKDAWRPACRRMLLLQAIDLSAKNNGATDAAEFLRELYLEQGMLLGMEAKAFEKLTRPSQVMECVIKYLASELSKTSPSKEDKDELDRLPRHLLAAQFVAQNDLEHTVLLQRVWVKVLTMHLEQQNPSCGAAVRQVHDELVEADRRWNNVLEQLRGGEEKILRMWCLAVDVK